MFNILENNTFPLVKTANFSGYLRQQGTGKYDRIVALSYFNYILDEAAAAGERRKAARGAAWDEAITGAGGSRRFIYLHGIEPVF